jgi:hypothetical protein
MHRDHSLCRALRSPLNAFHSRPLHIAAVSHLLFIWGCSPSLWRFCGRESQGLALLARRAERHPHYLRAWRSSMRSAASPPKIGASPGLPWSWQCCAESASLRARHRRLGPRRGPWYSVPDRGSCGEIDDAKTDSVLWMGYWFDGEGGQQFPVTAGYTDSQSLSPTPSDLSLEGNKSTSPIPIEVDRKCNDCPLPDRKPEGCLWQFRSRTRQSCACFLVQKINEMFAEVEIRVGQVIGRRIVAAPSWDARDGDGKARGPSIAIGAGGAHLGQPDPVPNQSEEKGAASRAGSPSEEGWLCTVVQGSARSIGCAGWR